MLPERIRRLQASLTAGGWPLLPLRLMVGFGFAAHGWAKLSRGPSGFAQVIAAMGLPAPDVTSWLTTLVELAGGVAMMLGVAVAPLAVAFAVIMLVAMFGVHLPYGFSSVKLQALGAAGARFGPPGYELNLLYIAGLVTLALSRPSPLSVDRRLAARSQDPT